MLTVSQQHLVLFRLQRVSEYMNYAYLLRKAATLDEAELRIQWVATFAVSALASNFERMGKPFNPLLGETYELERPDFRILCEQVSPIFPYLILIVTQKPLCSM